MSLGQKRGRRKKFTRGGKEEEPRDSPRPNDSNPTLQADFTDNSLNLTSVKSIYQAS
jgi:hypothetical protein